MSTDDLVRRAREWARLMARYEHQREYTRTWRERADTHLAERDAARAALERVTDLLTLWAHLASRQANLGDVVHDLTRALEGEA